MLISACYKPKPEDIDKLSDKKIVPAEIAIDVEFIFSDSGLVKAKINAPYLEVFGGESPYAEMTKGLKIIFYDASLSPNAFLRADYGKRLINEKLIELRDSVVVVNLKGDTLKTEELIWNERKDLVYSDRFVTVKTKDEIIKSYGFESDPTFSYYKFFKITGTISLEGE